LLGTVLSVCTCWFYNMVTLPPWLVSTDSGTCSYHCFLSNCTPVSLHCWSVAVHTLYHVFLCAVLLPVLGMLILCGLLSRQIVGTVCSCYLSLCSIFLSHIIVFVAPGLVLPLFHFQFLLLGLLLLFLLLKCPPCCYITLTNIGIYFDNTHTCTSEQFPCIKFLHKIPESSTIESDSMFLC